MDKEKLKLTKEEANIIICGDDENFVIIKDNLIGNSRWSISHSIVIQRKSDNKYFKDSYRVGATEAQCEGPYEYSEPDFTEVFPVIKSYIDYE